MDNTTYRSALEELESMLEEYTESDGESELDEDKFYNVAAYISDAIDKYAQCDFVSTGGELVDNDPDCVLFEESWNRSIYPIGHRVEAWFRLCISWDGDNIDIRLTSWLGNFDEQEPLDHEVKVSWYSSGAYIAN
jgi:hypothetical protein